MASRKKLQKELGAIPEEENVAIVPTESLPKTHLEMKEHKLVSKVKREMTPAQKINMAKMIEANKSRFENIRKAKVDAAEAAEKAKKDDIEAKLASGTHVRVKIIPKTKRVKKEVVEAPPVSEEESSEEYQASTKPAKVKVKKPLVVDTTTATDTETEPDESYKNTKRKVRREIKKNVRALKEIDEVMNHAPTNPYLSYLTGKWK